MKYGFLIVLLFFFVKSYSQTHSLSTELTALYDLNQLPRYSENTYCAQVSSYDTTGGNDDGFSGRYSYIRRNTDSTLVIFEARGPGVINRIWTPTPSEDTLDFYIDHDDSPSFSIKYLDLFSGKQYPFVAPLCGNQLGGYYCYLPVPFARSCKIVYRGKKTQFHQIQYKLFASDVDVKPFSLTLNGEDQAALKKISTLWNKRSKVIHDFYTQPSYSLDTVLNIKPGSTATLFNMKKGGRILGIEIEPATAFEEIFKHINIRMIWDNERIPAVHCPLADFFGYAFGKPSMQSLMIGTEGIKNYCYLPMPYDQSAKIELSNMVIYGSENAAIKCRVHIYYDLVKRRSKEGKLYTQWNKVLKSTSGQPHVFADIKGKGHYIGTILQAQGLQPGMTYFFEGDDSTCIDGEMRLHGTGSEDHFNGGWYALMDRWDGAMSLPLHGALDYSLPFCRTGGYRFYLSDKLSFTKSFYHTIEHGPTGNAFPVDYTSLGFYYADRPPSNAQEPTTSTNTVYMPDTLYVYPQLMDYNIYGNVDIRTSWKYGTGGESYLFTPGDESAIRISLNDIPKGKYGLYFDINTSASGCDFSVWQRQTMLSDWISTMSKQDLRIKDLYIRDIDIGDFDRTISLRFKTGPAKSTFLLHRIKLIRK